jgi:bacterioferritin (cytochrome b1)
MTVTTTTPNTITDQQLALLTQYTVEAYKTFEKLGENLPNPMSAQMFRAFAVDERELRDLLEMKIAATGSTRVRITLAGDLRFQDMHEGELSFRELTESLIARERAMERRVRDFITSANATDRYLLTYILATKRAHAVELERELDLIRLDADWYKREDAESRIVNGPPHE